MYTHQNRKKGNVDFNILLNKKNDIIRSTQISTFHRARKCDAQSMCIETEYMNTKVNKKGYGIRVKQLGVF